jgi:hypothetical protein
MRLGALGLPQYRPFALEELEEATHNFNPSLLMGENFHGKVGSLSVRHCCLQIYAVLLVKIHSIVLTQASARKSKYN